MFNNNIHDIRLQSQGVVGVNYDFTIEIIIFRNGKSGVGKYSHHW